MEMSYLYPLLCLTPKQPASNQLASQVGTSTSLLMNGSCGETAIVRQCLMRRVAAGYNSVVTGPAQEKLAGTSNYENPASVGACHHAEYVEIVELLLKAGADPNLQISRSRHGNVQAAAAFCGSADMMRMLIDAGANGNASSMSGRFPRVITASIRSDISYRLLVLENMKQVALDRMAAVVYQIRLFGRDLYKDIIVAATRLMKEVPVLPFLIEAGADVIQVHPKAEYGSALIVAAHFGRYDLAKCLIEEGADVNLWVESQSFATALQAAQSPVTDEDRRRIQYCVDAGYIAEEVQYLEEQRAAVAELLLKHGATV